MARYHIFEKTKGFDYKYLGTGIGKSPNEVLNRRLSMAGRRPSLRIKRKGIYVCIPDSQFTRRYQVNPTTTGKGMNKKTVWKRPR